MSARKSIRVGRGKTITECPICARGDDGCSVTLDGQWCCCVRTGQGQPAPPGWKFKKPNDKLGAGGVFAKDDPEWAAKQAQKRKARDKWSSDFAKFRAAGTDERLARLSDALNGVTLASLKALEAGYSEALEAWTFPLRNEKNRLLGFACRYERPRDPKNNKGVIEGTSPEHGQMLVIPTDLATMPDPVFVVEGASDVAACHDVGIAAVGRQGSWPSDIVLGRLLHRREVVIVAEWDVKPDGRWPGKELAEKNAEKLALIWGRPVRWSLPPHGVKDSRKWIQHRLEQGAAPPEIRDEYLEWVKQHGRTVEHEGQARPDGKPTLGNVLTVYTENGNGKSKASMIAIPLDDILAHMAKMTDGWPHRVNGLPFVLTSAAIPEPGKLPASGAWRLLEKPTQLFAWLQKHLTLRWPPRPNAKDRFTGEPVTAVTKEEFHAAVRFYSGTDYESVEILPHYPAYPKAYYLPCDLPAATGEALEDFRELLNPLTEIDRDLIVACLLTLGWGGPYGGRPPFIFQAKQTGAGKTETAKMIARVWGGYSSVKENERWDDALQRLLSESALLMRAWIIDNIKGRFSNSTFEDLITADYIDGKKMYTGDWRRPNNITWMLTSNSPRVSTDITSRAIPIHIGPRQHGDKNWEKRARRFIEDNRASIIADCLDRLRRGAQCEIADDKRIRFNAWTDGVLATFYNANEMLDHIRAERDKIDADLADSQMIAEVLHQVGLRCGFRDLSIARFTIRKTDLREWLVTEGATDSKMSINAITTWIKKCTSFEPLAHLEEYKSNALGKRWIWSGPSAPAGDAVTYDLVADENSAVFNGPGSPVPRHLQLPLPTADPGSDPLADRF